LTPEQFLARIEKRPPAPVYLFVGPEPYMRRMCREALVAKVLPADIRAEGSTQVDLSETSLSAVLDDARSLSLFAKERVLWVSSAETALPRRLSSAGSDEDEEGTGKSPVAQLASYLKSPTEGTVLVFDCGRYDFADDKAKLERVVKFYEAISEVVELRPFTPESVRALAQELAQQYKLKLGMAELPLLLDAVGGDASRLIAEMEKLFLYVGPDRKVTAEDIRDLVPNASQTTIFELVNALGRRDRAGALKSLDLLVRDGEYLPLALTFLGTQFRLALAAREAGIHNSQQAVAHFTRQGVRMWRDRAEQLMRTADAFTSAQLQRALQVIYQADKGLRDTRPDDRVVMESLVLALTKTT
jgi:DNA polymerase III subunit delta